MALGVLPRNETPLRSNDDQRHLAAVLRLAGCRWSEGIARALLDEAGSLGAVLAFSEARLARFGVSSRVSGKLAILKAAHTAALRRVEGDRPLIDNLDATLNYLHATMAHSPNEVFRVLFLDIRHRLIRDEVVAVGTVSRCQIYSRELVFRAFELAACGLVLVHNHPSGALEPSYEDIALTAQLVTTTSALDILIDDHLIVGRGGYFSFRSAGLISRRPAHLEPQPPF